MGTVAIFDITYKAQVLRIKRRGLVMRSKNHRSWGRYLLTLALVLFIGLGILSSTSTSFAYVGNEFEMFETEELDILAPGEEVLDFGIESPQEENRLSRSDEDALDILAPGEEVLDFGIESPQEENRLSRFSEVDPNILAPGEEVLDFGIESPQEVNSLSRFQEEEAFAGMLIMPLSNQGIIRYAGGGHTGGTVPAQHTLNVPGSATLRQPGTMVRSGHTFAGWRSSSSGNVFAAGATVTFTTPGTVTYTAVWTQNNAQGTIRYAGGGHTGGTVPVQHTLSVPGSAILRQPGTMVRSGHTFAGWRSSSSGNVFAAGATVQFTTPGTVTYTAVWTQNNAQGIIRYAGGGHTGGTVPAQHTLNVPGSATLRQPGTMVRSGHTFAGWRSSSSGNVFAAGATVQFTTAGTVTYTAVWNPVAQTNITLTFNPNGGSVNPTSRSIARNTAITAAQLPTPTRTNNRHFVDWFTTSATTGGTRIRAGATFSANTTIWARWTDPARHMPYWTRPANSGITPITYRITDAPDATSRSRLHSGALAWNQSSARVNFIEDNSSPNRVSMRASGGSFFDPISRTGTRINSFILVLCRAEVRNLAERGNHTEAHVARYIMVHEFGHTIGLEDNPTLGSGQQSVMTQGVVRPSNEAIITPFDVTGVNMIY